jgi:NAD(P)-dependent dehydrogenase (short-subunit alcohol dehydrogenase family)
MIAVVTGASSGIGAAIAGRLVRAGHHVLGLSRRGTVPEIVGEGRYEAVPVDLADPAAREAVFARLATSVEDVGLVVNNAGACTWAGPMEIAPERWRSLMELNFWAPLELTRALLPRMRRGALVVNVTSVTARHLPGPRFSPYAVTKSALSEATAGLRLELLERGIRVTEVAPGLVDTPIYEAVEDFARVEKKLREQVPRWLSPEDLADVVEWLVARPPHVDVAELVVLPTGQGR